MFRSQSVEVSDTEDASQTNARSPAQQQVLEAAAACFAQFGYRATSLDDVAGRMNATKGRIYHHYRSKSDLYLDVCAFAVDLNFAAIKKAHKKARDPQENLAAMAEAHVKVLLAYPDFHAALAEFDRVIAFEALPDSAQQRLDHVSQARKRYVQKFKKMLQNGRETGQFSIKTVSHTLHGMMAYLDSPSLWFTSNAENGTQEKKRLARTMAQGAVRLAAGPID